ncbi:heme ABC transporter ATP-binding protein [Paenibacillus sp. CAA11]|uniref:ABC transporter ATP-binding protein n=1 Tax=Paenibacillus sp. CAA11 TaxID=1532905 RepID=UPI000D39BAFA|nr:ABC transporter ATP-binding protein [Paenibacillus sp. CAA11]AWB46466.1 heme ABC transporter ATP-binding protein [Paenibacillus sp. CAA11]
MKKAVIEFNHFGFQYRAQSEPTLHDIELTLYEGEKVLIVGPSGSGKSTLAHSLNGLIPFYYPGEITGSLKILGEELKDSSISRLSEKVGTVLQDPDGQFVGLTVAEDIAFKLENDAISQEEMKRRVAEAAHAVDIQQYLGASPHALSGGQKQKTTLGGVLVNDVDILLFDEPLANLDPAAGKKAIELIDQVHEETGKTIVIIEHRLEDVLQQHVDRIVVVKHGRIVADMSADELLVTEILSETGIREPLYITALKYAGCTITPDMHPGHVDTIELEGCKDRLYEWLEETPVLEAESEQPPILELEDVSFSYEKGHPILRDIGFQIRQGEMVSIVGRNGAGKSTISKLICGFYRPTSGRMLYKDKDLKGDTIKQRAERIGFVMQNPNHMISKTMIFDEIALGLRVRGVSEEEVQERVHEVLRVCGLYAMRNWPISALSFGQKKRVTIASILVLRPEVIILDEPTAGQDFKHYNDMMEFLRELNCQGMTVIIITHDMHLMLEYTRRTIVLSEGRKLADAHPAKVLTLPEVMEAANLKETSIARLAQRVGIGDAQQLMHRFIDQDRRVRSS